MLAKKQDSPPLHFTRTERDRCRDVVGSSDEEEEEDEGSDSSKGEDDSGQADAEVAARGDIADIIGRYNVVWKYETGMGSQEVSWLNHTVMISLGPPKEVEQQDPRPGPGTHPVIATLVYGAWRGRWSGSYSKEGGLRLEVQEMDPTMEEALDGPCSLSLHSRDVRGSPFLHCEFDTGSMGCALESGAAVEEAWAELGVDWD